MPPLALHTLLSYLAASVLLCFYGQEVCPFIDGLQIQTCLSIFAACFGGIFLIRHFVYQNLRPVESVGRARQHLHVELGLWIAAGLAITVLDMVLYNFPAGSGLKVLVGAGTIGLFAASHQALCIEEMEIKKLSNQPEPIQKATGEFLSISTRFMIFLIAAMTLLSLVVALVMFKDITGLMDMEQTHRGKMGGELALELGFVLAVVVTGCVLVAKKLGENLRLVHEVQVEALHAVLEGNYHRFVPVIRNDEQGMIGLHTNQMILGLQEKAHLKSVFGKLLSPTIAKEILEGAEGTSLGGREVDAVVLFTDLRNFTGLAESTDPAGVVTFLNAYFGMLVEVVYKYDGVVDKFIGDAAMAVFGLEGNSNAADRALQAAIEIHAGLHEVNQSLKEQGLPELAHGIGVHLGPLIAGNIGSENRMEYTVIGDAVNTASRLEGMTKSLQQPILLSKAVADALSKPMQEQIHSEGVHSLKGKAEPMELFGVGAG